MPIMAGTAVSLPIFDGTTCAIHTQAASQNTVEVFVILFVIFIKFKVEN